LLLYASDPAVEQAIRLAGADGAIDPTRGDYLYVVDTNTSRDKVNQLVDETVDYHATVQPDRSILATAVIHYTNNADVHNINTLQGGQPTYSDFVRVFAPAGSTLLSRDGLDEPWVTLPVHNKTQFAGWFTLPSHASRTVTFRYRIPANADPGGQYTLLVQKQPGTAAIPLRIDVSGVAGITLGSSTHLATMLDGDVALTAPLSGGTPRPQRLHLGPAEPPVTPGSHPEPWVTVPTGSVAAF
jgi:hypothetical protein